MSKHTFKVGDRVQYWDEDDREHLFGEIKSIFIEDTADDLEFASVLWDDYSETEDWATDLLEPEGTEDELEAEFKKTCDAHMQEIEEQLELADQALAKAVELSEKYGLPFYADASPLAQSYFPMSFEKKFSGLDEEFVSELTDACTEYYGEGAGWEHSDVC